MIDPVVWRLAWKEYRLLRAFWISIAALTVLIELLIWWNADSDQERIQALFIVGLGLPAFYALGCGATMFATEHETGTYPFQRALPVTASRLMFGKLAFAIVSQVALFAVLWCITAGIAGWRLPDPWFHSRLWGLWGIGAIELLVWGILFSLLTTRPVKAALLGVAAASFSVFAVVYAIAATPGPNDGIGAYSAVIPFRIALVAPVAAAGVWLAVRWFRESPLSMASRFGRGRDDPETVAIADVHRGEHSAAAVSFRRLIWQHWRQSLPLIVAFVLVLLPVWLAGLVSWLTAFHFDGVRRGFGYALIFLATALSPPLIGVCVFLPDTHAGKVRFLAERGVRASAVWLSRHLVWLGTSVVLLGITLAAVYAMDREVEPLPWLVAYTGIAYCTGQLFSMFVRKGIVAAFLASVVTGLLMAWTAVMHYVEYHWAWSVLPVPASMLLATWLRSRAWMIQRNDLSAWFAPALTLLMPVVALLTIVPMVRVYEIPLVDLGFSPEEYARPHTAEEDVTLDLYRQAVAAPQDESFLGDEMGPTSGMASMGGMVDDSTAVDEQTRLEMKQGWLKANRETLRLTLEATQQRNCSFYYHPIDRDPVLSSLWSLRDLLKLDADHRESRGDLDGALDRHLAVLRMIRHTRQQSGFDEQVERQERSALDRMFQWAKHKDQTPERIAHAIKQFEDLMRQMPPVSEQYKADFLLNRRLVEGDEAVLRAVFNDSDTVDAIKATARWAPWEQARAQRLLDHRARQDVDELERLETAAETGDCMHPRNYRFAGLNDRRLQTTWAVALQRVSFDVAESIAKEYVHTVTRRRTTLILLAVEAWRLEHGQLPDKLEDLVGPYLEQLPTDPYSRGAFSWFPRGHALPIYWSLPDDTRPLFQRAGENAEEPFLWSAGPRVFNFFGDVEAWSCSIDDGPGGWRVTTCQHDLLQCGWLFPVEP